MDAIETYTTYETIAGKTIQNTCQITTNSPVFYLPGVNTMIPVDMSLLSKHILLIGGIGMGKTNAINFLVRNIRLTMNDNDVMVIFDPKGDYYQEFYREGDIVISNDDRCTDYWNVFEEITVDGRIEENTNEVASYFFKDKIEKSSNPFFPSAAKDVFSGLMQYIIKEGLTKCMNNRDLRYAIDTKTAADYTRYFNKYKEMRGISAYIGEDAKGQTQGVISEFQQAVREIFVGNFKKNGQFSIRKTIRNRGKKVIFIEYDLGLGHTLAPIYTLLIDLAIKEALTRKNFDGNVYFVMDEFRLMSALSHMDNGINFGRSLGAKFILGLQNAEQMYDVYGEVRGRSILSGCSTMISFNVSDEETRKLIKERSGTNVKWLTRMSQVGSRGISEHPMNGNGIEDWDIGNLEVGEAIVQSGNVLPFRIKFRLFK